MKFNDYMYSLIEAELENGIAEGRKIHCAAFIKKRIIQTLVFGSILAILAFIAISRNDYISVLPWAIGVVAVYIVVLCLTPFKKTALKLCRENPDTRIRDIVEEQMFNCTH